MTISFSGLASGLDTSSWVESLVALKQAKVETLEEEKENVMSLQETLNSIKSFFSSFRSMLEKVTDAKFGVASMDLFAQNLATSSNLDVLTASATTEAEEGTYDVLVDQLASETQAVSNYSYMTTIIQTTTATGDSKLINLGVKAGNIGVNVNGVERGITITENDTISTFIEKLKNIGVEASYNEETGIFSINVDDNDINDIDGTGIVAALHLEGVNEGYTSNSLQTSKTDTVFSAATEDTLLSELGVNAGVITVEANDTAYNITIYNTSTLGTFISDLRGCNIDASLDENGIFTITDAEITSEGATNILDALGLTADVSEKSQITGDLTHQTVITQVTAATSSTLLRDIGDGTTISNGQTVIVKNSNNEYTTITVGTTTTIGELLAEMSNAGLYAAINSDGTVEITGGTITGGTFDAVGALGLEKEPYSAMVTGNALTETVEVRNPVTLQTRLVDDLKVTEGYLEVTDADGDKEYLKIYSGQTIADLMTDLANYGLSTDLDEETGVLSITGGAFKTLTDADVQALVNDGTIRETDSRYIHGTNLLECLYGAGTISTDHITVASTYSKTQALSHSVINTINASLTTTLGDLGLNNGTAVFDVRGEKRTINVTTGMTIEDLMDALANQGIASSWDNEHSKIMIENSTLTGGTSNLADVLNLTETISGKYVTSDQLYARETITIDATRDTVLADYGITNSMSTADRTVNLYHSDGTLADSMVVGEGTTIGNLLDFINAQSDISASLQNGILTIHNGYIENAALEASMGLETSNKSSYVLGNQMTVTTTAAVTGETTLGSIIATLGTQNEVAGGYTLNFNGTNLAVSANTTLNELINMIYDNGGTAALDHTGRLSINGGTLTGTVAEALGIKSVTHTSSVSASGETLYTEEEVYADRDTTLGDLGINNSSYIIRDNLGNALNTINVSGTTTIGTFLDTLKANGIEGVIANGVISLESLEGKYITGALADALGIAVNSTTEVVNTTQSSTAAVTHTGTVTADITTTLGEIGAVTAGGGEKLLIYNSDQVCIATISSLTTSSTIGDMFDVLGAYGIQGSIINGVISLYSESGSYAAGEIMDNLGITVESGINKTFTIGQTITSSDAVLYDKNVAATEDTKILSFLDSYTTADTVVNIMTNITTAMGTQSTQIGTLTISATMTFADLFDALAMYGIQGSMEDGVMKLVSTFTSTGSQQMWNTVTFSSKLTNALGLTTTRTVTSSTTGATSTSTTAITYTTVEEMTADTKLGDIYGTYKIDCTMTVYSASPFGSIISISTAQELQYLANLVNSGNAMTGKTFVLTDDIDLSGISDWESIGASGYFNGTFDGQGHTISHLRQSLNKGTAEYGGLFGRASDSSVIKNVNLYTVSIQSGSSQASNDIDYVGAVVGYSSGSVSGVNVTNLITDIRGSAYFGGIAGFGRFISNSSVQGNIDSYITNADYAQTLVVGGIVGLWKASNSTINRCNADVDLHPFFSSPAYLSAQKVGGLVGLISTSNASIYTISNSSFTGDVYSQGDSLGSIVGELEYTGTGTAPAITLNIQNSVDHTRDYSGAVANLGYAMLGAQTNLSSSVNINVTNSFSDASHGSTSSDQKDFICTGPATVNLTNSGYKNGGSLYQAMVDSGYDMSMWDADGNVITSGGRYHMAVYDKDGNQLTSVEFSDETTIEDIMNALRPYGNVSLTNGVLSFTGTDGNLMVGGLAEALGIGVVKQISTVTVGTTVTSTAAITYTEVTTATRDTQIGDIITTYKIDGTITASGVTGTIIGISTAQELEWLADIVNRGNSMMGKTFVLTNNIDMSGITDWTPIGEIGTSSGSDLYSTTRVFAGTFDGQGHTISNLTMTSANPSRTDSLKTSGLFGCVANATIKNVNLNNFHINTDANFDISAGFLVARTNWGNNTISGITVANSSASCSVGGVVGQCYANTNISDCFTQFTVNTPNNDGIYLVGGITAEIRNWFTGWAHNNTLTVNITGSSSSFNASGSFYTAGGIVGRIYQPRVNATISDSGFTGSIRTTRSGHHGIAGIVGNYCVEADADKASYVTIKNTYSDAALSDTAYSGARNSGIINITGDYATRPTVFNSNISLIDNYYSGSYNSYLLIDSQFATVSTSNVQGNVSVSQFATIAAQRGFSPVDWDYASGLTTNTFAGPYQLIVKDKNGRQLYSSANQWDENTTLGEVMDVLKKYGDVTLIDGVLTFKGTDGNFITGLFAEDLGIETVETTSNKTVGTTATSTAAIKYMETVTASASTQLGELVNTLVIDGTITASGVTGTVIGISTAQQLEWLADIVNRGNGMSGKTFVLLNDIDMSGIDDWTPIGDYYLFRGTLDGQGHTIRNLTITSVNPSRTNANPGYGLFGYMNGTVKNLNLDNFYFDNDNYVDPTWGTAYGAGFLGVTIDSQYAANIENVSVTNSRATGTVAGLIHSVQGGTTIRNCSTSFTLTAPDDGNVYLAGGIVNSISTYTNNSTVLISGCSSDFTASGSYYYAGGIAGSFTNLTNNFVTIEDCYFEGSLKTSRDHYLGVGGIIGNYNAGKNDCTGTLNINRVFSNATLSASNPTQNVNGIIGGTDRDWGAEDPWTGTSRYTININGAYYRNNYDAYYLSNSYATVNANYVGRLADSDDLLQTPAAAGFSPDKWDLRSSCLHLGSYIDYSNPYVLFVATDDYSIDSTYTFNENTTLASIVSRLQADGYDVTLENGTLKLNDEFYFLGGPLAEYLGIGTDVTIDTIQNSLFSTAVISSTLTSNSTLDQVYLLSTGLGIAGNPQDHSYEISVYKDGSSHDITVSGADTLDDLFTQLAAYGVQGHVVDGRVQIDILEPNVEVYEMDSGLWTALKFNDPSFQNSYNVDNTYSGPVTAYEETNANREATLRELGMTSNQYIYVRQNGVSTTVTLRADSTLADMFSQLAQYGITGNVNSSNGRITLTGSEDAYITSMSTTLRDKMKLQAVGNGYT